MRLGELARLIRSKNAGPFQLTFDVMFDDPQGYERARDSGAFTREKMAALFCRQAGDVDVYFCELAQAIKVSMPRPVFQGDIEDSDGHGGQQYAPLIDIEI